MNYTKYLKQVYLHNLIVARDYNCDFVLVNYNSEDDIDSWIRGKDFQQFLLSKKLLYYYTDEPSFWRGSHAVNVAHRLGDGDVLCNLDADNFLTKEYLDWLFELFSNNRNIVTEGVGHGGGGRVAVFKEDFNKVGGYTEGFFVVGGYFHRDFIGRVCMLGRTRIENPEWLIGYINQPNEERVSSLNDIMSHFGKVPHHRPNHVEQNMINPNKENGFGNCHLTDYFGNEIVLKK